MKKVFIHTNPTDGKVFAVETKTPSDWTDDMVRQRIVEYNGKEENRERQVSWVEVSDIVFEAFKFLLGRDHYRGTYTIRSLIERMESLKDDIKQITNDVDNTMFDISAFCHDAKAELKDIESE